MYIKHSLKLLWNDIRFKNGFAPFFPALIAISLMLVLIVVLISSFFNGTGSLMGVCAGLTLLIYMVNSLGQAKRLEDLEEEVKKDKIKIKLLSRKGKDKGINLDRINQQMKDMQDD